MEDEEEEEEEEDEEEEEEEGERFLNPWVHRSACRRYK